MDNPTDTPVSRRKVLRTSAYAAGTLGVGVGATGNAAAAEGGKRGGRAQVDGEVQRNKPFTIKMEGTSMRNASCFSAESAMQTYIEYSINYCGSDDDSDATLYIIPDEAELVPDETYVIHSVTPCRASDLSKVAIGPAQTDC